MPVKTTISEKDYQEILCNYNLGKYRGFKTFANGAGQTTIGLKTTSGKYVLRYYENRDRKHVLFEVQLFHYLLSKKYLVPAIIKNKVGKFFSEHKNKPYVIVEFIDGKPGYDPNKILSIKEMKQVVKVVAQLHNITKRYNPSYFKNHKVYDVKYCWREFKQKHPSLIDSTKGKWFRNELEKLEFPRSLPKGLCHADLNYGNFLFKNNKIVGVLDFDMSFYTYFIYDIASLIYWWARPPTENFKRNVAIKIVEEYSKWRQLSKSEKTHIFDALKLITLLGIGRSEKGDFEKSKKSVEILNSIGRESFLAKP